MSRQALCWSKQLFDAKRFSSFRARCDTWSSQSFAFHDPGASGFKPHIQFGLVISLVLPY